MVDETLWISNTKALGSLCQCSFRGAVPAWETEKGEEVVMLRKGETLSCLPGLRREEEISWYKVLAANTVEVLETAVHKRQTPASARVHARLWHPLFLRPSRCYPALFGRKIARMLPYLMQQGALYQPLRDLSEPLDARKVFQEVRFLDNLDDFNIVECLQYVRGAKRLQIPQSWVRYIPPKWR